MKILILGCNGMVGHVMTLYFKEHNHDVFGYDEKISNLFQSYEGSFEDKYKIKDIIDSGTFDAVINCTAIINNDAEEAKVKAIYVNSLLPHYIEEVTSGTKTVLVHRSTDCIYSGKKGLYTLADVPDGDSFYARSKALGEVINDKDITIRTSLVGPEVNSEGKSLYNWFYNQKGNINGYVNAIWTGITTIEFAREVEFLLLNKAHGLFQTVPNHAISKYELLKMFLSITPGNRNIIKVENKRVDKSLVPELGNYNLVVKDYNEMINDMALWIKSHSNIYKHYHI